MVMMYRSPFPYCSIASMTSTLSSAPYCKIAAQLPLCTYVCVCVCVCVCAHAHVRVCPWSSKLPYLSGMLQKLHICLADS